MATKIKNSLTKQLFSQSTIHGMPPTKLFRTFTPQKAYWIHAVLHKIEGDEFNSRYWYERAQQSYDAYNDPKQELTFIQNNL